MRFSMLILLLIIYNLFSLSLCQTASVLEERLDLTVKEGVPSGTVIGKIKIKPGYTYRINERNRWFDFDPKSGEIKTSGPLDRESLARDVIDLVILGSSPAYFITVRIQVLDLNDNSPAFPFPFQNVSIPESARIGTQIVIATARDPDSGVSGRITKYDLFAGDNERTFELVQSQDPNGHGAILLQISQQLDREKRPLYILNISATDGGIEPRTGYMTVFVNVLDSNDNAPKFEQNHYSVTVNESLPAGSSVVQVKASDVDIGLNGQLIYYLSNDPKHQFQVDSLTGVISSKVARLNCPLTNCKSSAKKSNCTRLCVFTVEAQDHGNPAQRGRAFVNVELLDENDHSPDIRFRMFPSGAQEAIVDETKAVGSVIAVVTVVDEDSRANGETEVKINGGNELGHFRLDNNDLFGLIRVNAPLDREKVPKYNLSIVATDKGTPPRSSRRFFPIHVRDVDDLPPKFTKSIYYASIAENSLPQSYVLAVSAHDQDEVAEFSDIVYTMESGNDLNWFDIDTKTGLITTTKKLDFEKTQKIVLKVGARNGNPTLDKATATVNIAILDSNIHSPKFTKTIYAVALNENSPLGTEVVTVMATDGDSGKSGQIFYKLEPYLNRSEPKIFDINEYTGQIVLSGQIDREEEDFYRIFVIAYDNGLPPKSSRAELRLTVRDSNDNMPYFVPREYFANVLRTASAGTVITKISAQDNDLGRNSEMSYFILQSPVGAFDIDTKTGVLTLRKLPVTRDEGITVIVGARDSGDIQAADNATVYVTVIDNLNQVPKFSRNQFEFTVREDAPGFATVGKVIGTVSATDLDAQLPVQYKITNGDSTEMFEIGRYSGEIRSKKPIDRELKEKYSLTVVASGHRGVAQTNAGIRVLDANDNAPEFISDMIIDGHAHIQIGKETAIGIPVFVASAVDKDLGDKGRVKYEVRPESSPFVVDNTGLLSLKVPGFLLQNDTYNLEIVASDMGQPSKSSSVQLRVSVNNANDDIFYNSYLSFIVPENTPVNSFIDQLNYTSWHQSDQIVFRPEFLDQNALFSVFPDGWIYVKNVLDYEHTKNYRLQVLVTVDVGKGRLSSSRITVDFYISDINDNDPRCSNNTFWLNLPENSPPLTAVGRVRANDPDSGLNGLVNYKLISSNDDFIIDAANGLVQSLKTFDREQLLRSDGRTFIAFKFRATDNGQNPKSTDCYVRVEITDQNDHYPQFSLDIYTSSVAENKEVGGELLRATATDEDEGVNSEVSYSIIHGNKYDQFSIDSKSGVLTLNKAFDREIKDIYHLTLLAEDNGNPKLNNTAYATIEVLDVNDNMPTFIEAPKYGLNLSESLSVGSLVAQFTAVDKDSGSAGQIRYSIASGNVGRPFEINPVTGQLILVKPLDFESAYPSYTLGITAADQGAPSLSTSQSVVINILDENDNAPEIEPILVQVMESVSVGTAVFTMSAKDKDSGPNGEIKFELIEQTPKAAFTIDKNTGTVYSKMELDKETADSYRLRVVAKDQPINSLVQLSSERTISVIVTDANDNSPRFVGPHAALLQVESSQSGHRLAILQATDIDSGMNGSVGFRLRQEKDGPDLFSIGLDGSLYVQQRLYQPKPIYRLRVEAMDKTDVSMARRIRKFGPPKGSLTTSIQFTIITLNSKENGLRFTRDSYDFDVSEDQPKGAEIGSVFAQGAVGNLEYYITRCRANNSESQMPIDVDQKSGMLRIVRPVDREKLGSQLLLDVYAVDVGSSSPSATSCKVKIAIMDVNDERPIPSQAEYRFEIAENAPIGSVLGTVSATDPDIYGEISFAFTSQIEAFAINSKTGVITTQTELDRETKSKYRITVNINDGLHSAFVPIEVEVTDINDNSPFFVFNDQQSNTYSFTVLEGAERNSFVGKIEAVDPDSERNGQIRYRFLNADMAAVFRLDAETGIMTVNGYLDREQDALYILDVEAEDQGDSPRRSTTKVYISVQDLNDNGPVFVSTKYDVSVHENVTVGTQLSQLHVSDPDTDSEFDFSISAGDPWDQFSINSNGTLVLSKSLDREMRSSYKLTVIVYDKKSYAKVRHSAKAHVTVTVLDVNDVAPIFLGPKSAVVAENSAVGTVFAKIRATDFDEDVNGQIEYHLDPLSPSVFSLDAVSGQLRVNGPIDRETRDSYNLIVWLHDRGSPSFKTKAHISVTVLDVDDNEPRFLEHQYELDVDEEMAVGTSLMQLGVVDRDLGQNAAVKFWIEQADTEFSVEPNTGVLMVGQPLNVEHKSFYNLSISIGSLMSSIAQDVAHVIIRIRDNNDWRPRFVEEPVYVDVAENLHIDYPAVIGRALAEDRDSGVNGKLSYSIIQGNTSAFKIDSMNGQLQLTTPLDRESQEIYELVVQVTDSGVSRLSSTGRVIVTVLDTNDNRPIFDQPYYMAEISENATVGSHVVQIRADDLDEGNNGLVRYHLKSANQLPFKIDSESGVISTSTSLDRESQWRWLMTVVAEDSGPGIPNKSETQLQIDIMDINDHAPTIANSQFDVYIKDSLKAGDFVYAVDAVDPDFGKNGHLTYKLSGHDSAKFSIDPKTGVIVAAAPMLLQQHYSVIVNVNDNGSPELSTSATINFYPRPSTDFPVFKAGGSVHSFRISEAQVDTEIVVLIARSPKKPPFNKIHYSIAAGNKGEAFEIDPESGRLKSTRLLDRELNENFELWIAGIDSDSPALTSYVRVTVIITDINDNAPKFDQALYKASIEENVPNRNIAQVSATDADVGINAKITYKLTLGNMENSFAIDSNTGVISTLKPLDRERVELYRLTVEASDGGETPLSSTARVDVTVLDKNDNSPKFKRLFAAKVTENSPVGTFVIQLTSVDPDSPEFSNNTYYFTSNPENKFSIDPVSGNVTVAGLLDRETKDEYTLKVKAVDGAWRIETSLIIKVIDVNDNKPMFTQTLFFFDILEMEPAITKIGQVTAKDIDALGPNSNIRYSLATKSDLFSINQQTGELSTLRPLVFDRSHTNLHQIVVIAKDRGQRHLESSTKVLIKITERNKHSPEFDQQNYLTSVRDGSSVGTKLVQIHAVDKDGDKVSYFLMNEESLFEIDSSSGWLQTTGPMSGQGTTYHLTVEAKDNGIPHNTATVIVTVEIVSADECTSIPGGPCKNGGYCENTKESYRCICMVGFHGQNCQHSIDHCSSNPCKNNGICVKQSHGYRCKCNVGDSGKNCQIRSHGFDKLSYVELPKLNPNQNYLSMQFATLQENALLLYSYNSAKGSGDYVALDIVDGKVRLSAKLFGQGQMNLILQPKVNDGNYHQVQIDHAFQSVTLSVAHCFNDECRPCAAGNSSCQITAFTGLPQILVPGDSIFLGGVKSFGDLLSRPGQVSSFNFIGCLRDFEINGKGLESIKIKSKNRLLNYCPRPENGYCSRDRNPRDRNPCAENRCVDRWNKYTCLCERGGFESENCEQAERPHSFNGGLIRYSLTESYRRSLLFQPVDTKSLVNSDDLFRKKRSTTLPQDTIDSQSMGANFYDLSLELDFRTLSTDGLLFLASSGDDFSMIDIINGTLRYFSRTGGRSPLKMSLEEFGSASDGNWHRIWLMLRKQGREISFRMDGLGKTAEARTPMHLFLDSRLSFISVGGVRSVDDHIQHNIKELVTVYGVVVPEFTGCLRRFVLNQQAQLLANGSSGYLDSQAFGQIESGCFGPLGCVSPPCTSSPLNSTSALTLGVIVVIAFFGLLFALMIITWCVLRRYKRNKERKNRSPKNNLSLISQPPFLSGSASTLKADSPWQNNPYRIHMGNGAYQNRLMDTCTDEATVIVNPSGNNDLPERYDLDNASSIAPSDIDVSTHYRAYREGSYGRNKQMSKIRTAPDARQSPLSQLVAMNNNNNSHRSSPASVKQLKAALRGTPGTNIGRSSGSSEEEQFVRRTRSRPGSAHSSRSGRSRNTPLTASGYASNKGSLKKQKQKTKTTNGTTLSVKDLRRYHSNPTFEGDSSSSSNEAPPPIERLPSNRREGAHRILSKSAHAPPLRDSSSEETEAESITCSELDLDKVRKPRKLLAMPDDTETESETGLHHSVPSSLAPFRPPRSMFPVSEDESDAPSAFRPIVQQNGIRSTPPRHHKNLNAPSPPSWYHQDEERDSSTPEALETNGINNQNLEAYV